MSVALKNSVLTIVNTSQVHVRAQLINQAHTLSKDFRISAVVAGSGKSDAKSLVVVFGITDRNGTDALCGVHLPNDGRWHKVTFSRLDGKIASTIDGAPSKVINVGGARESLIGYFYVGIEKGCRCDIRDVKIESPKPKDLLGTK